LIWSKKFRKRACIFQIAKLPHFSIFPNLDFGGTPLKNSEIISANFILIVLMNIQTGRFQKEILKNMKKHPEKSKILRKVSEIAPFARIWRRIVKLGSDYNLKFPPFQPHHSHRATVWSSCRNCRPTTSTNLTSATSSVLAHSVEVQRNLRDLWSCTDNSAPEFRTEARAFF